MKTISPAEKLDILLVLARAFEKKFGESGEPQEAQTILQLAEKSFAAAQNEGFDALRGRAAFLDNLPDENRARWQEIRLDKLRRRGRTVRLDENINPSHISNVLSREPARIQNLILKNLPVDLSRRIAAHLDMNFESEDPSAIQNGPAKQVADELMALIRRKFLANFVALEDVYEPKALDKFSVDEMEDFIRHLGLREVAIACRGINSKETLAAFLSRFEEEDAREIALYITELEKIRPYWVALADELVRKSWSEDLRPERVLKRLGLKLLAVAFTGRDETTRKYTAQKLSIRDARSWQRVVRETEKKFSSVPPEERLKLEKRRKIVERLAVKFSQTGRL